MKNIFKMVLIIGYLHFSTCFFLNLGAFLRPVLKQSHEAIQEQDVHNIRSQPNIKNTISKMKNTHSTESSGRKNKGKKIHKKGPSKSKQQWAGRKKRDRNNLREQDFTAISIYQQIGLPIEVIYEYLLPVHIEARFRLNSYFYKGSNSKKKLYQSLKKLKDVVQAVTKTYFNDQNSSVEGQDNFVIGERNILKGNQHKIIGNNNIVFNNQHDQDVMKGNNIVRIDRFDIKLQQIDKALKNPSLAVDLLDE